MTNPLQPIAVAAGLALALVLAAPPRCAVATALPPPGPREADAATLAGRASERLRRGTIESRRGAIADLEQAVQLAPDVPEYQLRLARAYSAAGFLRQARERFERVTALAPGDAEARFGLARMWRRDYLKYLDTGSLQRAIEQLGWATRLDPSNATGWVMLASLELERGDLTAALSAALGACARSPRSPEALAALGAARWRLGEVEGADSAFAVALPRLPARVRERFDDLAPLATEQDTAFYNHLPEDRQREYARRFWSEHDPDLATPENEARLEYWARVAQAWFLWYDTKHDEWDERGEVYVRFGPPEKQIYNPVGESLSAPVASTSRFQFPMNVLRWEYPALGMSVTLQDHLLSEYYLLKRYTDREPDPHPDPEALERLGAVTTPDARGVFPALPPGARNVPFSGQVARFEGGRRARLVSTLEVEASPADSLVADYVVLDSTDRVTTRGSRTLSPSACEAARFRVADFASDLSPGRYRVGLSLHGPAGRGALRIPITVPARDSGLALSDLVVTCGTPEPFEPAVRLAANPSGRVPGDGPLTAYFEIYRLTTDGNDDARFEISWVVRSDERDPRLWFQRALSPRPAIPTIEATRRVTQAGPLRRQFVSVPVSSLPAGRYRLEVTVRDLLSGAEKRGEARFTRPATP